MAKNGLAAAQRQLRKEVGALLEQVPLRWVHVKFVPSDSRPGVKHELKRNVVDGRLGCSCESFKWSRGKLCKHIIRHVARTARRAS